MPKVSSQKQEEEVEALVAFYGEELVKIDRSRELLEGSVSIELEPKKNAIVVYIDSEEGRQSFKTKQLSPIDLVFRFPIDYPTAPIDLSLQSLWLTAHLAEEIHDHLEVLAHTTSEPCFLLRCCDAVKNFVEECDLKEICLDGNPYSIQNNVSGLNLLNIVRNSCKEYEDKTFNQRWHDCEVCYDNKSGPECVKFNPCGHVFCKECVRTYFLDQLTAMRVAPLSCLSPRCESYPSEILIEELVGEDHFERYQRIILSNVLARIDDIAFCPRPRCQNPAPKRSCTSLLAICPVCDYSFCIKCHRAYHGVNPCRATVVAGSRMVEDEEGNLVFKEITVDEYLAATDDQRQEMAWWYGGVDKLEEVMDKALGLNEKRTQKVLEKYTKTCPTCGIAIMVDEGCNEVFCRCGTWFCYGCGEILAGEEGGSGTRNLKALQRAFTPCPRHHK
ncbi:hypothetical protein V3C99_000568 [Haemonchus contortus]